MTISILLRITRFISNSTGNGREIWSQNNKLLHGSLDWQNIQEEKETAQQNQP